MASNLLVPNVFKGPLPLRLIAALSFLSPKQGAQLRPGQVGRFYQHLQTKNTYARVLEKKSSKTGAPHGNQCAVLLLVMSKSGSI